MSKRGLITRGGAQGSYKDSLPYQWGYRDGYGAALEASHRRLLGAYQQARSDEEKRVVRDAMKILETQMREEPVKS